MATENANATPPPPATGGGKKKKLFLYIGIVVLLLGGGGAGYYFWHNAQNTNAGESATADKSKSTPAKSGKKESAAKAEPIYLALDPAFVVNFQDDNGFRFLQIGVQVMARQQPTLDAVKAAEPAVRNALVMLFSSQSYSSLSTREGKEKLRAEALAEIQKIVTARPNAGTIEDLYFTSFVMQ